MPLSKSAKDRLKGQPMSAKQRAEIERLLPAWSAACRARNIQDWLTIDWVDISAFEAMLLIGGMRDEIRGLRGRPDQSFTNPQGRDTSHIDSA